MQYQLSRQLLLDEMAFSPKMLLCKGACYPNRSLLSFLVGEKADAIFMLSTLSGHQTSRSAVLESTVIDSLRLNFH